VPEPLDTGGPLGEAVSDGRGDDTREPVDVPPSGTSRSQHSFVRKRNWVARYVL